ncbi:unnamed protein product [Clonostachys rosea]|uniref:Small secreted protein n=1 Tax=Bionectria ochroleuca TaxID=29856 RepID=A0ABY6US89_BIOOC|nr:unnamed protein product [Clonostachys rosea]
MQFSTAALFTTLLSATALAVPAQVKSMAASATWTIEGMKRTCNGDDTSCDWSFGINTGAGTTACAYSVGRDGNTIASRSPNRGTNCGAFTITSAWSGQFGDNNGFTTLSVVDNGARLIAWPAYTDAQLVNGQTVQPDQSYPVQALP